MKGRYESEIESLKKEMMEMNTSNVEKDARRRVQMAEEKAELVKGHTLQHLVSIHLIYFITLLQGSLRKLCSDLKHHVQYSDSIISVDERGRDENYDDRNRDEAPFPSISAGYSYYSSGNRGPTPRNAGYSSAKRPNDLNREAQERLQEATNLAAFNVLQNQVIGRVYI